MTHVPFLALDRQHQELRDELASTFTDVLDAGVLIGGPQLAAFEAEFAAYCEAPWCVGVGNGFDALELALRAVGVQAGDDVLVPAATFIATWGAVSAIGARPVPVDPEPGTWVTTAEAFEAAMTPATRAIVPVHLYGRPAPIADVVAVARRHGVKVVEDAAQAHGARVDGRRLGAHADAAAFSFYPVKNLGALGDAGAVTMTDGEVAARVRRLGNYGAAARGQHDVAGRNSRLDELQAALLRVKLRRLDGWNARRREIAGRYHEGLAGTALTLPDPAGTGLEPVWHLYAVSCAERPAVVRRLEGRGVQTLVHYPVAPHRTGAYAHLGLDPASLPVAERWQHEVLSLPLHPHLTDLEVDAVIAACREELG